MLHRDTGALEHRYFCDLPEYLRPGDVLVLNDTKVIAARLWAERPTGGRVEILLLQPVGADLWECLARPGRRAPVGMTLRFGGGRMTGEVVGKTDFGGRLVRFNAPEGFDTVVDAIGQMPLPHYIKADLKDPDSTRRCMPRSADRRRRQRRAFTSRLSSWRRWSRWAWG